MKKIMMTLLLPFFLFSGCVTTPREAANRVDNAKIMAADANAQLMYQNAVNYSSSCQVNSVTLKAGRYCGSLDKGAGTVNFTGDAADLETAQNTYTNGMTRGYYCVMIGEGGKPTVAYWSDTVDLSSAQLPAANEELKQEPDKIIGRYVGN